MKPTPEFVKYLMAPEREPFRRRLNEEWEKRGVEVGDDCIGLTIAEQGILGIAHKHLTKDTEAQPLRGWVVTERESGRLHWHCREKRVREDWQWLPSLSQLLDMVEAEGLDYNCGKYEGEYSAAADQARPRCEELDWERVAEGRSLWGMEIAAASLLAALWGVA